MFECVLDNKNNIQQGRFPKETPLAMCYVPMQEMKDLYPENTALEKGTIFPDLYFPFRGKGSDMNG